MTSTDQSQEAFVLHCERCGYVVEGLPTEEPCPECGRPIHLSLPERRSGTPWQNRRSIRTLLQTWWRTVRHPIRTFDTLRLDRIRRSGMVVPTLLLCSAVCWSFACLLQIPTAERSSLLFLPFGFAVYAFVALVLAGALLILSGIIAFGLQVVSGVGGRGTRIGYDAAWHIVGLASVGWVLSYGVWLAAWSAVELHKIINPPQTDLELRQRMHFETESILFPAFYGGFSAGFLVFLGFVLLGAYRLRYANAPAPVLPSPPAAQE